MKKLFTIVVAIFFMATTSFASSEFFYRNTSGQWSVYGHPGRDDLNPACIAQTNCSDGSTLMIIQDLADGELYIHLTQNQWNIEGPYPTNSELELNFYKNNRIYLSVGSRFSLTGSNTIVIRGIDHDKFLGPFTESERMVFVIPGNVPNLTVGLRGVRNAFDFTTQCLRESQKVKTNLPKKGGQAI